MTTPIKDVASLPGRKVSDQEENTIGEVKEIYAIDGDGEPMWITVEASTGMTDKRIVFIPLARLKEENGDLRVPYSKQHIIDTPEVDGSDGISAECDRKLRDHYGIDRADQELRGDNDSYATLVPEGEGTAKLADDPDSIKTPDADKTDEETQSRLEDVGSADTRNVTAEDVVHDDQGDGGDDDKSEDEKDEKDARGDAEARGEGDEDGKSDKD